MPNRLFHTLRPISSASVNVAASNFPAANVISTSVDRQWRSSGIGTNVELDLDLGADVAIAAVCVQHTNAPSITVRADAAPTNPATTVRGTITPARDYTGRGKGALVAAYTARRIRLNIAAATPTVEDNGAALGYFYIGCVYVWGSVLNMTRDALFGSTLATEYAQATGQAGGQEIAVDLSPGYTRLQLNWSARPADDIERTRRLARAAPCWLDLDLAGRPAMQWPVRSTEAAATRNIARPNGEAVALALRELV